MDLIDSRISIHFKLRIEATMVSCYYLAMFVLMIGLQVNVIHSSAAADELKMENKVKTNVFLSPEIVLEPGSPSNKFYYNIDFPRGHLAIKDFNAELVDEKGNSVPLYETYLHHWTVMRYFEHPTTATSSNTSPSSTTAPAGITVFNLNQGVCGFSLPQYFGVGAETRGTKTSIPDPYGLEVGNPGYIPAEGYEERWVVNLHVIDTRDVVDKSKCSECLCDLYNVDPIDGYIGGFKCCRDATRCKLKPGFDQSVLIKKRRSIYLKYYVKYVDWEASIVPVQIYILDSTDTWTKGDDSNGQKDKHSCWIEYDVESCPTGVHRDECVHKNSVSVRLPKGGDVIYGVGHQHAAGIGTALYGEDGREICLSNPIYGEGEEAGNEAGYIVGMTSCYPSPGSIKISAGEMLSFVSLYNNTQMHTGVMGLFYLLIAEPVATNNQNDILHASIPKITHKDMISNALDAGWAIALFGFALIALVIVVFRLRKSGSGEGYEAITA